MSGAGFSGGDGNNAGGDKDRKGKAVMEQAGDDGDIHESQPLIIMSSSSSFSSSDEDGDEVQQRRGTLDSLGDLEDALPIKRYYSGKSRSFANLIDLTLDGPQDLGKKEYPVNKKRRLLLAHKSHRRRLKGASSASASQSFSMPAAAFPPDPTEEEEGDDDEKKKDGEENQEEDHHDK